MSRMRVGLVCGHLDPGRDGVADYTRRLAAELRFTEVEPVVVTTHRHARDRAAVGATDRWDVRGVAAAARVLRDLDLDVVHVQFAPSVFGHSRAVGLLPLLLPDVPLVVTLHEYGVRTVPGRVRPALWAAAEARGWGDRETLLLVPRAARLLVPSPEHLAVLHDRCRWWLTAALEVPVGVNVELSGRDRPSARAQVRRELGADPDAPLVVFFGFLHREKALDRLIAAVAAVRAERPAARLLLIGGTESHSVPRSAGLQLRRELEQVAAAHGMADAVRITGYLPDAEVDRLLRAADVAALPFDSGVTRKSSSLLTALAAGVPVITTAPAGELDRPTEDDGVLRVPPRDTVALTDALRRVLGDGALAGRLRAAGQARAAAQGWPAIAATHAAIYGQVAAGGRGTAGEPRRAGPRRTGGDVDVTA